MTESYQKAVDELFSHAIAATLVVWSGWAIARLTISYFEESFK